MENVVEITEAGLDLVGESEADKDQGFVEGIKMTSSLVVNLAGATVAGVNKGCVVHESLG